MRIHEIIYGFMSRLNETPAAKMEMISEFPASLEVKKITAMNTNKGLKRLAKYGTKFK